MAAKIALFCLLGSSLGACAHTPARIPEPTVQTVTVKVPVAVPCPALVALGPEPQYADTDAAIQAAPDIFSLAKIYAKGRLQRVERLASYVAAKFSCL